ncbi:MAG: dTMP kinase [Armatimonadetes bacterium]|nr:dTMP kinase [Armatimonadota bacterium]
MSGLFITIEGIEGAGKTTLTKLLSEHLKNDGADVVVTAEPGGDTLADGIRKLLLDSKNAICDRAELLLFEAARAQHVDKVILPALERGAIVICDRFSDSSLAYQGYARGIDLETIETLNNFATRGLKPDLTILLDLPVELGLARQTARDRISSEQINFHRRIREGYLSIVRSEPERFVVIDASGCEKEVFRQALEAVISRRTR